MGSPNLNSHVCYCSSNGNLCDSIWKPNASMCLVFLYRFLVLLDFPLLHQLLNPDNASDTLRYDKRYHDRLIFCLFFCCRNIHDKTFRDKMGLGYGNPHCIFCCLLYSITVHEIGQRKSCNDS